MAVVVPIALLTASAGPWNWEFAVMYLVAGFVVNFFVRLPNEDRQTLIHVLVLGGTAPLVVRFFFGNELGVLGTIHVAAVLAVATGVGFLLADSIRARQTLTDRHTG